MGISLVLFEVDEVVTRFHLKVESTVFSEEYLNLIHSVYWIAKGSAVKGTDHHVNKLYMEQSKMHGYGTGYVL